MKSKTTEEKVDLLDEGSNDDGHLNKKKWVALDEVNDKIRLLKELFKDYLKK